MRRLHIGNLSSRGVFFGIVRTIKQAMEMLCAVCFAPVVRVGLDSSAQVSRIPQSNEIGDDEVQKTMGKCFRHGIESVRGLKEEAAVEFVGQQRQADGGPGGAGVADLRNRRAAKGIADCIQRSEVRVPE